MFPLFGRLHSIKNVSEGLFYYSVRVLYPQNLPVTMKEHEKKDNQNPKSFIS